VVVSICSIYAFVFLLKSSSTYYRHIIKVYTSDRHDSENHTVVIRKMRSAGLYSTARYDLYFEQCIDGYIIKKLSHVWCIIGIVLLHYVYIGS